MSTMTISPIQPDYVTRTEFQDFRREFKDFKDSLADQFAEQRESINEDFKREAGVIVEEMRDQVKIALEHMTDIVKGKVDKVEFEERIGLVENKVFKKPKKFGKLI